MLIGAVVCLLISAVQGYDVLCVFPAPTRSHNSLGKGVVESLLTAGHNVTWVTPFPPKETRKGLTVIDSKTATIIKDYDLNFDNNMKISEGLAMMRDNGMKTSLTALTDELRTVMVQKHFDAVVTELFFNEFEAGYAAVLQVPWIAVLGTTLQPNYQAMLDTANTIPLLPLMFTDFPVPMNFWQRLATSGIYGAMKLLAWWETPTLAAHYEKMFKSIADARGVNLPPYNEISGNLSVLFVNSHPSYTDPLSLAPNIVEVSGYHIEKQTLPQDLQAILDSSCAIYFSFGSVLKSSLLPTETRNNLLKLFSEIPCKVLWKFEEELNDVPSNVFIRKWMPQSAVLAHPNIRAFITHGGMLSQIEAVSAGVPLISVPIYGDQQANARRAQNLGFGKSLTLDLVTLPQQIGDALNEVLRNESYSIRAKELSALFNNRPVAPSKLISHYIEIAIQSKGALHLRSKAKLYSWYEIMMLDQILFIFAIFAILSYILIKLICFIACKLLIKEKKVINKQKKVKKH